MRVAHAGVEPLERVVTDTGVNRVLLTMIPVSENVAEPTIEQARIRQVDVEVVVGPPVFAGRYLAATGDGEVTIRSIKLSLDLKRKIEAGFEVEVGV